VVQHDGYYYLLGSATNCCDGPLTGYAVFAGRSTDPLGPYVDRDGNLLLSGRVGGTPVLTQNGNRWVGPGGEYTIHDFAGQDWLVYH
jgi:arabinan endo-1,5-alpha-L-arabinosidase